METKKGRYIHYADPRELRSRFTLITGTAPTDHQVWRQTYLAFRSSYARFLWQHLHLHFWVDNPLFQSHYLLPYVHHQHRQWQTMCYHHHNLPALYRDPEKNNNFLNHRKTTPRLSLQLSPPQAPSTEMASVPLTEETRKIAILLHTSSQVKNFIQVWSFSGNENEYSNWHQVKCNSRKKERFYF